jgi:hypothetical protein
MQTALSPTRLTKVDPSTSANVHRLQNTLLALVYVSDDDRLGDTKPKVAQGEEQVLLESARHADGLGASLEGKRETDATPNDDDDDEAPRWAEPIGWREVVGFLTM